MTPSEYDPLLTEIADYVVDGPPPSPLAWETARWDLADAIGCGLLALSHPACVKLLGGIPRERARTDGARVPGTSYRLDPVEAAFNLGTMIRWLDYNDTWLALEWGHPSDNVAAILAVADWLMRRGQAAFTVKDVLRAMIRAHEIQGVLSLSQSLNRRGLDHVLWVKVASTAAVAHLLGGDREMVARALSQAFVDLGSLRTYRHAPDTGSRKSWAAGDAASRAVRLALITARGEMGYPRALSAPGWGFEAVVLGGEPLRLAAPLGDQVMENVLFKIAFPAEFHGQTAVEAALRLHPRVLGRMSALSRIILTTQESAMRIIDKRGPLRNPADRDHCLQYMVAVALLHGRLTDASYSDETAADPRIDALREKMVVVEEPRYSADYLDPAKRSIANAVTVEFSDGGPAETVEVEYPLGHRRRREEAWPLLRAKFAANCLARLQSARVDALLDLFGFGERLEALPVTALMDLLAEDAPLAGEGGEP